MAHFGLKINKTESPDKKSFTYYYPHSIPIQSRNWNGEFLQFVSIDPGKKNYSFRIERRYHSGKFVPLAFHRLAIADIAEYEDSTVNNTYQRLTEFLNQHIEHYSQTHYVLIERQLPQNYVATRIAQHTISYFSILLHNQPLLPHIIEVSPKLKGKVLGAPKGISDSQLKKWATEKADEILKMRNDTESLQIIKKASKKDDLSDTVCQLEAFCISFGYPKTTPPPTPIILNINPPPPPTVPPQITLQLNVLNSGDSKNKENVGIKIGDISVKFLELKH